MDVQIVPDDNKLTATVDVNFTPRDRNAARVTFRAERLAENRQHHAHESALSTPAATVTTGKGKSAVAKRVCRNR